MYRLTGKCQSFSKYNIKLRFVIKHVPRCCCQVKPQVPSGGTNFT